MHPMPFPAEYRGNGLMTRAAETDEILQWLVAEVRIGFMMHLAHYALMPQLTAIVVALQDQTTSLTPAGTPNIAEIDDIHANPLPCRPWPIPILPRIGHAG
jgi:hypothetical protein